MNKIEIAKKIVDKSRKVNSLRSFIDLEKQISVIVKDNHYEKGVYRLNSEQSKEIHKILQESLEKMEKELNKLKNRIH